MLTPPTPNLIAVAALLGLAALAAAHDLRAFRIPNWIPAAILALYPVHVLTAPAVVDWTGGLMVGGVALAAGFALFSLGRLGGGDAKLFAACAVWAGPERGFELLVVTGLAGGLLALLVVSPARLAVAGMFERIGWTRSRDHLLADCLPYGVAIAAGGGAVGVGLLRGAVS